MCCLEQQNVQFTSGVNCKENPLFLRGLQVVDTIKGMLNVGPQEVSFVCLCAEMRSKASERRAILGFEFLEGRRVRWL